MSKRNDGQAWGFLVLSARTVTVNGQYLSLLTGILSLEWITLNWRTRSSMRVEVLGEGRSSDTGVRHIGHAIFVFTAVKRQSPGNIKEAKEFKPQKV